MNKQSERARKKLKLPAAPLLVAVAVLHAKR